MNQTDDLTSREWEVINHLLEGKSNKMIAAALHVSVRTVEFHLKNIFSKFHVSSRTELILKLGKTTVAQNTDFTENNDNLNFKSWMTLTFRNIERFFAIKMNNTKSENINIISKYVAIKCKLIYLSLKDFFANTVF